MFLGACAVPSYDSTAPVANALQIASVLQSVNLSLTSGDCNGALTQILPLYNSANSDNDIRIATAESYACLDGIEFFKIIGDLTSSGDNFSGSGLWEFLAQEFPSTTVPVDDKKPLYAESAMDALMATLNPPGVILPADEVNSASYNPGSIEFTDRTDDANSLMALVTMAQMGTLLSRGGLPSANGHKSQDLPWTSAATTPGEGCAFVAALLQFDDSLQFMSQTAPGKAGQVFSTINTFLGTILNAGCMAGCTLCGITCSSCPTTLRDRNSCTGSGTDPNSCAAAGLLMAVNASWVGPP